MFLNVYICYYYYLNLFTNNFWIEIERQASAAANEDGFEGTVSRKHEWEHTTKKSSNRSWDKVYLVLRGGDLAVYKVFQFKVLF